MTMIDMNCDMGERDDLALDVQERLMESITSANVACGAHAGNEALMRLTLRQARAHGVAIGAHPGYPDRDNFGRLPLQMPLGELEASIEGQIRTLVRLAGEEGVAVSYVKPHGALYNQAAFDAELAHAIARAISRVSRDLSIYALAGSPALATLRECGFQTVPEAFADRRYEPDGSLRPRRFSDALFASPEEAAGQALRVAIQHEAVAWDGSVISIEAQTLCIHGDSPGAADMAREVRLRLEREGIAVYPISRD